MKKIIIQILAGLQVLAMLASLVVTVVECINYRAPENVEPLDYYLSMSMFRFYTMFFAVGLLTAILLLLSLRAILYCRDISGRRLRVTALVTSGIANVLFYLIIVLIIFNLDIHLRYYIIYALLIAPPLLLLICLVSLIASAAIKMRNKAKT